MLVFPPLDAAVLPAHIRSRFIDRINGLRAHVLEAVKEAARSPCIGSVRSLSYGVLGTNLSWQLFARCWRKSSASVIYPVVSNPCD